MQENILKNPAIPERRYTPAGVYQLFMVCAFPIHIWAILMAFSDFSWVAERTRPWDAVGLISYALIFALIESLMIFIIVWLLGFLTPKKWEMDRRVALLGSLYLVVASWTILGQIYFIFFDPLPKQVIDYFVQTDHPLRVIWGIMLPLLVISTAVPAFAIIKMEKAKDMVVGIFERITVLSSFYVALDLAGIVIVLLRSVTM